ncbi:thiol-disulfide oxidoreductase ResA [Bacillus solimangrovi]|uniref:Thiol-disulfide oxidoreductase n=1 Tax=Bacillus solimangrovi TaxID=1305675 RepID=A0A1E5LHI8_9BACI|nr:thiol-disulfide oxidoreductase ResA [Bacillus solimangrovi]OEH93528.1 thiol-disulfide oxidoreductase [Bacillus solimangrovi]
MKQRRLVVRTVILLVLASALGFTFYTNFFANNEIVKKGEKAPDFILENLQGEKVQLSDYEGKGIFLNFWGTWCKPCEKEMPYMENLYPEYSAKDVEILAVNVGESKLAVEKFKERFGLSFPILLDKDGEVVDAFGINPLPTTVLLNKEHEVVDTITGTLTEEMIRAHMERIKP